MSHILHATRASRATRSLVAALIASTALGPVPIVAAQGRPSPSPTAPPRATATPQAAPRAPEGTPPPPAPVVRVNRTQPRVERPALRPTFSARPTADEVRRARVLPERLVPIGPTAGDDAGAIAAALTTFGQRQGRDDWRALEEFAQAHPTSAWRPSVLANLATLHVRSGAYSRALSLYRQVWEQTRTLTGREERALADYVLGEWLEHSIKFGHVAAVKARLLELGDRDVRGTASAKVRHAREGVWFLENLHHKALFSGPEALRNLLRSLRGEGTEEPASLKQYMPTAAGTSAADLVRLAAAADLPLRAVTRTSARAVLPVPSIVHLRTDHFSMVLARDQGGYVVRDPVLGGKVWIRADVLQDEASGLVLAPASPSEASLEAWRDATPVEQTGAVGHCAPGMPGDDPSEEQPGEDDRDDEDDWDDENDWDDEDEGDNGDDGEPANPTCGGGPSGGMPTYRFHPVKASVLITDTPAGYTPPRGPSVSFTLRYDHRDQRQPQVAEYGDVGPRWTFDWLSYVQDNLTSAYPPYTWTRVYLRGQSMEYYGGQDYLPYHWRSRAVLVKVSNDPVRYERRLPDGTVEVFELPDRGPTEPGRRIFLTQVIDPQGQTLTFTYDSQVRLVAVTDAIGQVTTVAYAHPNDPLKVTSVTDPFGRSATLGYDGQGRLARVTDVIGLTSTFTYGTEDFIAAMTTPYGTTSFRHEPSLVTGERWVEATDPLGATERLEFRFSNSAGLPQTIPASEVPTGFGPLNVSMDDYNTLYWGPRAMATAPGQLASAVITSWVIGPDMNWSHGASRNIPHSVKRPLESRIWYRYPGQSATPGRSAGIGTVPIERARVLDDGSTQLRASTFNDKGWVTSSTDPIGRRTSYIYAANQIDLIETRQTTGSMNDLLKTYANYTSGHLPQSVTDTAGQTSVYSYNAAGQLQSATNALNQVTTYSYDSAGRLQGIALPLPGATTGFTYDSFGRLRTVVSSDGDTLTFDYDLFDRPTRTTYADGTYEETVYERLDVARRRDRLGRWTYHTYDPLRRLTSTRDPMGRTVRWDWCNCGQLDALIDGKGQRTEWQRDAQGRVVVESRSSGASLTTYTYDAIGRRKTVTDPKLQVRTLTYALDNTVVVRAFSNAAIATSTITYTYDPLYRRLATMSDGIGTTTYSYHPVGALGARRVATIDGPLGNDVVGYGYDELGRMNSRTINGAANSSSLAFDLLGRPTAFATPVGTFSLGYEGPSGRLATIIYPNAQTTTFDYYPAVQDRRLRAIRNTRQSGASLSKFDYSYDVTGAVRTWRQQFEADPATEWSYEYDAAGQLTSAVQNAVGEAPTVLRRLRYQYDSASNRVSEQEDDVVTGAAFGTLHQQTTRFSGGGMRFAGVVSEPAVVVVNGQPAVVSGANAFERTVQVGAGLNVVSVQATDANGNIQTSGFSVTAPTSTTAFSSDANGNLVSDGVRQFEWDALNQLTAVVEGAKRSEFVYDGKGRRLKIVEKVSGAITRDAQLVWAGGQIVEERMSTGSVNRFFVFGEQAAGVARYVTRDHLGSVREATDAAGSVVTRNTYDPYGRLTLATGADDTRFGFTGHMTHSFSGLVLSHYRAYDPAMGRWLSQDPSGMPEGPNRFAYVLANPVGTNDPDGRCPACAVYGPPLVERGSRAAMAAWAAATAAAVYTGRALKDVFFNKKDEEDARKLEEKNEERAAQGPDKSDKKYPHPDPDPSRAAEDQADGLAYEAKKRGGAGIDSQGKSQQRAKHWRGRQTCEK